MTVSERVEMGDRNGRGDRDRMRVESEKRNGRRHRSVDVGGNCKVIERAISEMTSTSNYNKQEREPTRQHKYLERVCSSVVQPITDASGHPSTNQMLRKCKVFVSVYKLNKDSSEINPGSIHKSEIVVE